MPRAIATRRSLAAVTLLGATLAAVGFSTPMAVATMPGEEGDVLYTTEEGLFTADRDGSNPNRVAAHRAGNPVRGSAWSSDGRRIAFIRAGGMDTASVWIMRADGSNKRRVTGAIEAFVDLPEGLSFSPDDRRLVLSRFGGRDSIDEIRIINVRTGAKRPLRVKNVRVQSAPDWSSANRIAFFGTGPAIWSVRPDGTGLEKVMPGYGSFLDWSPNGRWLLISRQVRGKPTLTIVKKDGSGLRNIAGPQGHQPTGGQWSPTGRFIYFRRIVDEADEIYADIRYDVATRQRTKMTSGYPRGTIQPLP
jgi:Tol biopolymer transport system component